jgi:4-hydroxybenzoate polyprenyltransferase
VRIGLFICAAFAAGGLVILFFIGLWARAGLIAAVILYVLGFAVAYRLSRAYAQREREKLKRS